MRRVSQNFERRSAFLAAIAADTKSPEAKAAFAQLIGLWHPRLLRFAQARVPDMAEDVLQEAVLSLAQTIGRLKHPERFGSWAFTVVARRAADAQRQAVRRRHVDIDAGPADPVTQPTIDRTIDLARALDTLDPADRRLLSLFHVHGLSGAELAAMLDLPVGTIKSRLHRVRAEMRYQLEKE